MIAKMSGMEFEEHCCRQTPTEYLSDLLRQCHRNAQIADRKYRYVKAAYQLVSCALPPWALTVYMFKDLPR
jgi:hypothetical protein